MCGFLLRIIINALVLFVVVVKLPGVFVDTLGTTLLGAAIIGIVNALIRPFFAFAKVKFTGLRLGGFTFAANIFTPFMVVQTMPGIQVYSALATIPGIVLMTACSFTLTKVIRDR